MFCGRGVAAKTKEVPLRCRLRIPLYYGNFGGQFFCPLFIFGCNAIIGGMIMNPLTKCKQSLFECKNVYSLAAIAMLLALRVVLGIFANTTLPMFGNTIKLSAAFLPIALAGAMFGPVPAAMIGALGDVISYVVAPTGGAFFPGFTLSGLLTGLIYGFALYKNQVTLPRVIIGWAVNMLVVETFLAAYWLWMLYGYSADYTVYLSARFISQAVKCVPEILLIFALGKLTSKIKFTKKQV